MVVKSGGVAEFSRATTVMLAMQAPLYSFWVPLGSAGGKGGRRKQTTQQEGADEQQTIKVQGICQRRTCSLGGSIDPSNDSKLQRTNPTPGMADKPQRHGEAEAAHTPGFCRPLCRNLPFI
jgi:hypothetical protein